MNILEAVREMRNGKVVSRSYFSDAILNARTLNAHLIISDLKGEPVWLGITEILADDWEIVPEKSPMEKAWEELINEAEKPFAFPIHEAYLKFAFKEGWERSKEHFKSEK